MKVLIEKYRGFEINFDNEAEVFVTVMTHKERGEYGKESKSYAAVKKAVDDFIKENQTFEPFKVRLTPKNYGYSSKPRFIEIIGVRKDGYFIGQNPKGERVHISEYDENDYILDTPELDAKYAKIAILELEVDEAIKKVSDAENDIKGITLRSLKEKYQPKK